jgi:hypothetical protein
MENKEPQVMIPMSRFTELEAMESELMMYRSGRVIPVGMSEEDALSAYQRALGYVFEHHIKVQNPVIELMFMPDMPEMRGLPDETTYITPIKARFRLQYDEKRILRAVLEAHG